MTATIYKQAERIKWARLCGDIIQCNGVVGYRLHAVYSRVISQEFLDRLSATSPAVLVSWARWQIKYFGI